MAKIKINTVGVSALKSRTRTIKSKANDCVDVVSYVRKNIDVEVSSSADIASRLRTLQKRMQAQEDKMAKYEAFLDRVNDDFTAADRRISKQAKNVQYLLNKVISLQGVSKTRQSLESVEHFQKIAKIAALFGVATTPEVIGRIDLMPIADLFNQRTHTGHRNPENFSKITESVAEVAAEPPKKEKKSFWDKIGDWCEDTVDKTKKFAGKVADAVEDNLRGDWEFISEVGDAAKDNLKSDWEFFETVVTSKPMEYVWETGKSVLNFAGDVVSFEKNIVSGTFLGAGTDLLQACNDIIDVGQDASSFVIELFADGCSIFGADEAANLLSEMAADYSSRAGISGELRAAGADGAADVIDGVGIAADYYDYFDRAGKIDKALRGDWKDVLSLFGWKLDSSGGAMISNTKMVTKYIDGVIEADSFKDFMTNAVGKNTLIIKEVLDSVELPADVVELLSN